MSLTDQLLELVPVDTAERLASTLTAGDVATLKDLVRAATPPNTIRAVTSDLGYLEAWSRAVTGEPLQWPPRGEDGLRFVAHHLFRPEARHDDPSIGMPQAVEEALRGEGMLRGELPLAPSTVQRRLSSWRKVAELKGYENTLSSGALRQALSAARKASTRTLARKSETAITKPILDQLVEGKPDLPNGRHSLRDLRDRTLLLTAFASGGRRRSEVGALRRENVFLLEGKEGYGINLGRTKTTVAQDGEYLVIRGRAAQFLKVWLGALSTVDSERKEGPLFPSIDRWGTPSERGLSGNAVNQIIKARAEKAGIDPRKVSAHGLRSGYLTEASRQGVPIEAAMRHSRHKSYQTALRYYDGQEAEDGKAAILAG